MKIYKKIIIIMYIILITSFCFADNDVSKFLQKSKKQAIENEIQIRTFIITKPELFVKINKENINFDNKNKFETIIRFGIKFSYLE